MELSKVNSVNSQKKKKYSLYTRRIKISFIYFIYFDLTFYEPMVQLRSYFICQIFCGEHFSNFQRE